MINYSKIVTKEQFEQMNETDYEFAVKEGCYHGKYLRNQFPVEVITRIIEKRAEEITRCGLKFKDCNTAVRAVATSNIVFPDNVKFIQALLTRNISYRNIYSYSRLISKLNSVALTANELKLNDDIIIANKQINKLCSLIRLYFGVTDYNIIVTKINEIAVHHKDLYNQLEEEATKNKVR